MAQGDAVVVQQLLTEGAPAPTRLPTRHGDARPPTPTASVPRRRATDAYSQRATPTREVDAPWPTRNRRRSTALHDNSRRAVVWLVQLSRPVRPAGGRDVRESDITTC